MRQMKWLGTWQIARSNKLRLIITAGFCVSGLLAPPLMAQSQPTQTQPPLQAEEPIITDEEFDRSIPPLSDDIDAPMESVADWEKQQAEREKAERATQQAGVAPIPALQDGDAVETLADAPVTDPEIDDPLPPLQGFDVQPLSEDLAADDDNADAARIRYDYRIEGLDKIEAQPGLDDELAINERDRKSVV